MHQAERRARTRARLVEAALDVFALSGYRDASVDNVAHAAAVSKGAFYFHFTSKEDVLVELLRLWATRRTRELRVALDGHEGDRAARVRALLEALVVYDDFRWPRLLVEAWSAATRSQEVARMIARVHRSWCRMLELTIAPAYVLRPEAEAAAVSLLALHDGLVCEMALGRRMQPAELRERVVGRLATFFTEARVAANTEPEHDHASLVPAHLRA